MSCARDDVAAGDDAGSLDDALELADVAGPGMLLQARHHLVVHALDGPAQLVVEALDEVRGREPEYPRDARAAAAAAA